jgi:hypothetical protein
MGRVVNISEAALPIALFGDKSSIVSSYIQHQLQNLQPVFNDFSQRVYNSLINTYNFVNDKLVQWGIRRDIEKELQVNTDLSICELNSFEALQKASITMQRWVMAHPEVRKLYLEQNIEGYSDSYKNVFGSHVGEEDYNFRRVMDGVIQDKEDYFSIKFFNEDLYIGDKELSHDDKVKILHTWAAIDLVLKSGFDFTSVSKDKKINL